MNYLDHQVFQWDKLNPETAIKLNELVLLMPEHMQSSDCALPWAISRLHQTSMRANKPVSRLSLKKAVLMALKDAKHDHPESLNMSYSSSITKRIVATIITKLKDKYEINVE